MGNLCINLNDTEYNLSTTLRVAYTIQGQHNHKPYADIFRDIGNMPVEQQIDILYAAFKCANPQSVDFWTPSRFREYYFDNYKLKDLLNQLNALVRGIMGEEEEVTEGPVEGEPQGN